jgi:cyclopropane fatty-acyl-phospholipid synthase-like methyltransferase
MDRGTAPWIGRVGPAQLDEFVALVDAGGGPSAPRFAALTAGFRYTPAIRVDQSLDPCSEAYAEQMVTLYREIAGRELDQATGELTHFDVARHAAGANPYASSDVGFIAMHARAVMTAMMAANPPPGARVLDLGCGWGLSTEMIGFSGARVTAVDINPKFAELVTARAARLGRDVEVIRASFDTAPLDGPYDVAFFYECLHHAVKPWETLAHVAAHVAPEGRIVLAGEPVNAIWWRNWGLRLDALSVYCIRKFGWFESGWSEAFLRRMFADLGWDLTLAQGIGLHGGPIGFAERRSAKGMPPLKLPSTVSSAVVRPIPESTRATLWHARRVAQGLERRGRRLLARAAGRQAAPPAATVTPPAVPGQSPFHHYNASFDALEVMRRHADPAVEPAPDLATNFLGVRIPPEVFPQVLRQAAGHVEPIPIPANWHADIAEWAGALRSIDLAGDTFRMVELGCGWGCWMANTGVAARRSGREVEVIGIEGDAGHIAFARQVMELNGLDGDRSRLVHGVAAPRKGRALFPVADDPSATWGGEPLFDASEAQVAQALAAGTHEALDAVPLAELAGDAPLDLLHIDIQGGEVDFVRANMTDIAGHVRYVVIGTHSREIEGALMTHFLEAGWRLEIDRPCIFNLVNGRPQIRVDGVQAWRAPA